MIAFAAAAITDVAVVAPAAAVVVVAGAVVATGCSRSCRCCCRLA